VVDAQELFLLAPKTAPPLTPAKVLGWALPSDRPYVMLDAAACVVGYAELNRMADSNSRLWIGHVLIAPHRRGAGYGTRLVRLLLEAAFRDRRVREVGLTVFPQNHRALACYRRAGFVGGQNHSCRFPDSAESHTLLWMSVPRRRFRWLSRRGAQ